MHSWSGAGPELKRQGSYRRHMWAQHKNAWTTETPTSMSWEVRANEEIPSWFIISIQLRFAIVSSCVWRKKISVQKLKKTLHVRHALRLPIPEIQEAELSITRPWSFCNRTAVLLCERACMHEPTQQCLTKLPTRLAETLPMDHRQNHQHPPLDPTTGGESKI